MPQDGLRTWIYALTGRIRLQYAASPGASCTCFQCGTPCAGEKNGSIRIIRFSGSKKQETRRFAFMQTRESRVITQFNTLMDPPRRGHAQKPWHSVRGPVHSLPYDISDRYGDHGSSAGTDCGTGHHVRASRSAGRALRRGTRPEA